MKTQMAEKHVLICSIPLAIREMQIQTTARFPQADWLTLKRRKQQRMTNAGENMGKRNPCSLLIGLPTGAATMEIGVEVPRKAINGPAT